MFKLAAAGMNTYSRLTIDDPSPRNPRKYPHNYTLRLKVGIIGLYFAADSRWAPWNFLISARVTFRPFRVIQGHLFCYQSQSRRPMWLRKFLSVRQNNLGPILHHFRDIAGFLCPWSHPNSTLFWGCSCWNRSPTMGSARVETLS